MRIVLIKNQWGYKVIKEKTWESIVVDLFTALAIILVGALDCVLRVYHWKPTWVIDVLFIALVGSAVMWFTPVKRPKKNMTKEEIIDLLNSEL